MNALGQGHMVQGDRGVQFASKHFRAVLKRHGFVQSMSRKGDCWDNSVAEIFFGTLKVEQVFDSIYQTREEAKRGIVDYIEMFYNSKRSHSYLGYLSPKEFEKMMSLKKAA